jgi:glycopeptide antibiotics resistance protein
VSTSTGTAIAAGFLVVLAALTLLPGSPLPFRLIAEATAPWIGPRRLAFLLNVLLFVPLGLLAGVVRRPKLLLLAFALTLGIETVQYLIPGRSPDGFDLLANSTGAVLGYAVVEVFRLSRRRAGPRPRPR